MQRRTFVRTSVASLGLAATAIVPTRAAEPNPAARELFELRTYTLKADKLPLLDAYLSKAFLPALERLGIGPVGVFTETESTERNVVAEKKSASTPAKDLAKVTVLIVHKTADSVATLAAKLAADEVYGKAATEYLAAKADDPVYLRIAVSLLGAFAGMPKLEKPDPSKPRLFNLRVYESHNERAAAKKVEMFEKGEIAIFRKVGLTPVFFASAITGPALPNLTYLLVFPDDAARGAAWGTFVKDPAWLELRALPGYADKEIVSRITNRILVPRPYSGI